MVYLIVQNIKTAFFSWSLLNIVIQKCKVIGLLVGSFSLTDKEQMYDQICFLLAVDLSNPFDFAMSSNLTLKCCISLTLKLVGE